MQLECELAGIVVYVRDDMPTLATRDIPRLINHIIANYRPRDVRFDRASLLLWLLGLEQDIKRLEQKGWCKGGLPRSWFERRLSAEVYRIARLEEPARTIAAVELVNKLRDASVLSEVVIASRQVALKPRHPGGYAWWKRLERMAHQGNGQ